MNPEKIVIEASRSEKTEANGIVGVNPNKPDFGSIMLSTTNWDMSSGFLNKAKRVHFLSGKVEELKDLVDAFNLKEGDDYSTKIAPSRLIVEESIVPFYDGQAPKINPSTSEVITYNGSDVYRETKLVSATSQKVDAFIGDTATVQVEEAITAEELPELNG